MKEQSKVFLSKIQEKIKNGEYDNYVSLFISRELIYACIKSKIDKKLETGSTPLLSDNEIKDALKDAKETSDAIVTLFLNNDILKMSQEGLILSGKGLKILKYV